MSIKVFLDYLTARLWYGSNTMCTQICNACKAVCKLQLFRLRSGRTVPIIKILQGYQTTVFFPSYTIDLCMK